MPSGAARRVWEQRLKIKNSKEFDWLLLSRAALNPIGNIRLSGAREFLEYKELHEGFSLEEIVNKNEEFIEFAQARGVPVSGTTGAGGDAPKFLLSKSKNGSWHPSGCLSDHDVDSEWIIKFLRGRQKMDHLILETEPHLYRLAESLGLKTGYDPIGYSNAVLIPRFDVARHEQGLERYGLESLASMMGISRFGVDLANEDAMLAIAQYSTRPVDDLVEFVLRDAFNAWIGNVDNHGRNTSFIKNTEGEIVISPIYDTAAMVFDPQLIGRSMRWEKTLPNPHLSTLPNYRELWGKWSAKHPNANYESVWMTKSTHFVRQLRGLDLGQFDAHPPLKQHLINGLDSIEKALCH